MQRFEKRQREFPPKKLFAGIRTRLMSVFTVILLLVIISSLLLIRNGNNTVSQYRAIIDTISVNGEIRGKMLSLVEKFDELQALSIEKADESFLKLSDEEADRFFANARVKADELLANYNDMKTSLENLKWGCLKINFEIAPFSCKKHKRQVQKTRQMR